MQKEKFWEIVSNVLTTGLPKRILRAFINWWLLVYVSKLAPSGSYFLHLLEKFILFYFIDNLRAINFLRDVVKDDWRTKTRIKPYAW